MFQRRSGARSGLSALATAAAIVTAIVTAAMTAAPAGAHARPRAGTGSTPVARLYLVEHAVTDTEVPVAPGGKDEKGDPLTFDNPVYDMNDTKRVGHDEGYCMRLDPKRGVWECAWTTFVSGGSLTVQGPFYDHRPSTLAVTGGTGRYSSTRGSMYPQAFDGGKRYHFDFDLQNG